MAAVAAIFATFSRRYLHKWDSAIEGRAKDVAVEWSERLGGLTADDVKRGLESWTEDWPPSSEEFRKACLGQTTKANEFGLDYVPEYHRQENRITDRSRLLSSTDRDTQRAKSREQVAKMKQALNGHLKP